MPLPEQWRAFLRAHQDVVRQVRLQSQAFVRGEHLSVLPLQFQSKALSNEAAFFDQWADTDYPTMVNWGAKFPPRSGGVATVDLDADLRPTGDGTWTDVLEEQASRILHDLLEIIVKVGGLDGRHRWGRASLGCDGHLYIPVQYHDKAGLNRLLSLTMKKSIIVGAFRLRIEVRVAPDPKQPAKRLFTLPGSIYAAPQGGGFDLIGWNTHLTDIAPLQAFPTLQPEPLAKLVKGLWAAILYAGLHDHWGDGNRHDAGLLTSGVLVRECSEETGFLDEADAREIINRLSDSFGDADPADRLRGLEATFAAVRQNRPITGYARLGELIGEEAKLALLRARGGGDPDAYAALLDLVAYVPHANGREDVWLDLSTAGHGQVVCTRTAIRNHFHPHPHFPVHVTPKGKPFPLIDLVAESKQLQRYHAAVNLPGVPFRTVLMKERDSYREANENEIADPAAHKLINIGPGYATPLVDEVPDAAWQRFWSLWRRHLGPLTSGNKAAIEKIEKAIAWAAQHPLEKIPLGLCFTGGGGIGKSVLFNTVLPAIFGHHVFGFSNVLNLESQFRLADLEGAKFYCIEEVNLTQASISIKELLKDLMKNLRMKINRKYGAENYVENLCIPIFLTNEANPGIVIRNQRERSLVLIQGVTRESSGTDLAEWNGYRLRIADHVAEFVEALKDPAIREAGMAYFWDLDVTRQDFEDNSELGDLADPRDNMDPIDEAIVGILEANEIHPKFRGEVPLTSPFKMEWLIAGIQHQLQQRGASRFKLTPHAITKRMHHILNGAFEEVVFKDSTGKMRRIRYIAVQYGDMITSASRTLGIKLEPAYEPQPEDHGENRPTAEECRAAWDIPFSTGPTGY